ncbi:MAG TPA: metal-dependent hydrolase [Vicinamibacteria bacterium]|nr:metal-dependent hydrolase [Vicinamibacteria bacterium]
MPLIGHALAGWATALESEPPGDRARALWVPAVIVTAYLPDAVGQLGLLAGWADGQRAGHSLLFAVVVSPLVAAAVAAVARASYRRAWLVSLGTLLLHDLMDVLQSTDRQPWWPFSSRPIVLDRPLIPASGVGEAALLGGLFLAYVVFRRVRRGRTPAPPGARPWAVYAVTAAVVLAAVATYGLRERRERQFDEARRQIERGDVRAGLELLDLADTWPSTARPGRADYLKGEAYARLGDRGAAEAAYLRSLRIDPGYFWAVADLAAFYAGGPEPEGARRSRVAPLLARLREEHPDHPDRARMERRIERALARPGLDAVP